MTKKREYVYIAQARLSHAVTGAITEKGQPHDVAHLSEADLERAIASGALLRLPKPFAKTDAAETAQGDDE